MVLMKKIQCIIFFLSLIYPAWLISQPCKVLTHSYHPDSSLYDICKINQNEFWIGGENGILLQCDTVGSFHNIQNLLNNGEDILKIMNTENIILLGCNKKTIFQYHKKTRHFEKFVFHQLHNNACIYDGTIINDSIAVVIGGNNKIAQGKKAMARGFILVFNINNPNNYSIIKRNAFRFYFSCCNSDDGLVIISAYNGLNSKLFKVNPNNTKITRMCKFPKLLFHEINMANDSLWLSGSNGIRNRKCAILFNKSSNTKIFFQNQPMIWSFCIYKTYIIGLMNNGRLLIYNTNSKNSHFYQTPIVKPLYEIVACSENKALVVGHGKAIMLIDLEAFIRGK